MKEYIITDGEGSSASILPEKGATVTSFNVRGREYLYRNQTNLASPERPRCGIPFLFPAFGRFPAEGFVWKEKCYPMGIHGFGHTSSWRVVEQKEDMLTVELTSDEQTKRLYPFDFRTRLCFTVQYGGLTIRQVYENTGNQTMPYAFGFHPYWQVDDPERASVETLIKSGGGESDSYKKKIFSLTFPPGQDQGGISIENAAEYATLDVGGGKHVRCRFEKSFTRLVLWSIKDMGFICVEPINSSPNGLATGDCYYLEPGESRESFVSFDVT